MMASRNAEESVMQLLEQYAEVIKKFPKDMEGANMNNPRAKDYLHFGDPRYKRSIRYVTVGKHQTYKFWKLPIDCRGEYRGGKSLNMKKIVEIYLCLHLVETTILSWLQAWLCLLIINIISAIFLQAMFSFIHQWVSLVIGVYSAFSCLYIQEASSITVFFHFNSFH